MPPRSFSDQENNPSISDRQIFPVGRNPFEFPSDRKLPYA